MFDKNSGTVQTFVAPREIWRMVTTQPILQASLLTKKQERQHQIGVPITGATIGSTSGGAGTETTTLFGENLTATTQVLLETATSTLVVRSSTLFDAGFLKLELSLLMV